MRKFLAVLMIVLFAAGAADTLLSPKNIIDESILISATMPPSLSTGAPKLNISSDPLFGTETDRFVAHRGFSEHAPENTQPAFELAGKAGFWGIETDIIETADGVFMCMHDDTLDRTTTGTGDPLTYTYNQLLGFDVDYGNDIENYPGLKIPTMIEYLNTCAIYDCVPVIEIKSINNYDNFLQTVYESGLKDRAIIAGSIESIQEIRARDTEIFVMVVGYSFEDYTYYLDRIRSIPAHNAGLLLNHPMVDPEIAQIIHSEGYLVGAWTLDTAEDARKFIDYGVDIVVTNQIPGLNHMINDNE
ncbi:MAG: glycerophosphodiester phosphodiesterase family protein [Clostridiales bacterium]|nr:glycerophosphodiester phosphodiesterase family protein [Clostridiales bacterium]